MRFPGHLRAPARGAGVSARLTRRDHPSVAAAIAEARKFEFWPVHRPDGLLVLSNGKERLAVQRETRPRSVVFHLVPLAVLEAASAPAAQDPGPQAALDLSFGPDG